MNILEKSKMNSEFIIYIIYKLGIDKDEFIKVIDTMNNIDKSYFYLHAGCYFGLKSNSSK